jgi:adenylate kinase family enzyme
MTVNVRSVRWGDEWVMGYDATVSAVKNEAPTRWWIVGASGSGKSTYGRTLAAALRVEHVEMDGIYHQAHWSALEPAEFRRRVSDVVARDAWILDGNYRAVRDLVASRAHVIVMLDFSRGRVMSQVVRRTLRRALRHEELWNGNREEILNLLRWDPHRSIIRWAWTTHGKVRESFTWLETLAQHSGAKVLRVRSHEEARSALAAYLGRPSDEFL